MFSWTKKEQYSSSVSSSSSKYTRQQHIQSYLDDPILNRSTRKVSQDDTTYDTVFQTKDQHVLILRVYMAATSSNTNIIRAPKMMLVSIQASHNWLDNKMRVIGYKPIQSDEEFIQSQILLSQAINAVVQHFQLNPPQNIVILDQNLKLLQNRHSIASSSSATTRLEESSTHKITPPTTTATTTPPSSIRLPPHASEVIRMTDEDVEKMKMTKDHLSLPQMPALSQLDLFSSLTHHEMNEILDDNHKMIPHLEVLPYVEQSKVILNGLIDCNISQAHDNCTQEETLMDLFKQVQDLQKSLKEKVDKFSDLKIQHQKLIQPVDMEEVLYRLRIGKRESMDESEEVAVEWLHSEDVEEKVDEFLKDFMVSRTIHHVRSAKMERLEEIHKYRGGS